MAVYLRDSIDIFIKGGSLIVVTPVQSPLDTDRHGQTKLEKVPQVWCLNLRKDSPA
jgi:hypothetical protein